MVANVPAFVPDLPAVQVHEHLRAALHDLKLAERNAVLWFAEVYSRKLYRELAYSSIHQYAAEALGFSKPRTYQVIRLAERLEELPELRRSVAEGSVSWTKAREVAKVATPATEAQWVEDAKVKGRRELVRQVEIAQERTRVARRKRHAPASQTLPLETVNGAGVPVLDEGAPTIETPVEVVLRFLPEEYARFEALLEAARLRGERGKREAVVLAALDELAAPDSVGAEVADDPLVTDPDSQVTTAQRVTRGTTGPTKRSRSPYQIHVLQCPQCGGAEIPTTRGPQSLTLLDLAVISCEAEIDSDGKNRSAVPPRLRRQVLARDRYRCRAAGCGRTRFLHVHHIKPREHGGANEMENLLTICASCHRLLHALGERAETLATAWRSASVSTRWAQGQPQGAL